MFAKTASWEGPLKGGTPMSISYSRHPPAHQSTPLPCPLLRIVSGARYSGVPQSVQVWSLIYLAKPKSHILTKPLASSSTFSHARTLTSVQSDYTPVSKFTWMFRNK